MSLNIDQLQKINIIQMSGKMQETVYEIFESIDGSNLLDTEDREVAEDYHRKGYIVHEHRIDKIPVTQKILMTVIVTEKWGVSH